MRKSPAATQGRNLTCIAAGFPKIDSPKKHKIKTQNKDTR
jgi:hypothetical protein